MHDCWITLADNAWFSLLPSIFIKPLVGFARQPLNGQVQARGCWDISK